MEWVFMGRMPFPALYNNGKVSKKRYDLVATRTTLLPCLPTGHALSTALAPPLVD